MLRRLLEAVEPGFRITMWNALARGLAAGLVVALAIDRGGAIMHGIVGAIVALATMGAFSPPRTFHLVRAELRARRIRGVFGVGHGVPIGPAMTYLVATVTVSFTTWIVLIVGRAVAGTTDIETPWSTFALPAAICTLLVVEGSRARRARIA